jgi:hypothetical protein
MRIRNTLALDEVEVSEPCLAEPRPQTEFKVVGSSRPVAFDGAGNLRPL